MNILLTLNRKYLKYMISLLRSIHDTNPDLLEIYIFSNDIEERDIENYRKYLSEKDVFHVIRIPVEYFKHAPVSARYPYEMYYRIFAADFLPDNLSRILYLDPDIIVKGSLKTLYHMDFEGNYLIGASNIRSFLKRFNQLKNGTGRENEYLNTGVLLMNLDELRKLKVKEEIFAYIEEYKNRLTLPDQDIIQRFYGHKVKLVDAMIYNLSDRNIIYYNLRNPMNHITPEWVEENAVIIHYFGKNKPWKENYHGFLDHYYKKYEIEE